MILVIWEYKVKPECIREFESTYGSRGEWISLFRRYPGFLETELLRKKGEAGSYITIDRWESEDSYHKFLFSSKEDYHLLDTKCDAFTFEENKIGVFEE